MAYFKPSYGVNGLGIPMGPMDAATLHHSMGYSGKKDLNNFINFALRNEIKKVIFKKLRVFFSQKRMKIYFFSFPKHLVVKNFTLK